MLLSTCSLAQADGVVRGTVLDQNGKPVVGVKVHIQRTDIVAVHVVPRVAETDAQGKFLFENVALGVYRVSSAKEEEGYPDTFNPFYVAEQKQEIVLTTASSARDMIVQLGAQGGMLKLASVADARSGKDISVSATLTLARASNPASYMITSATRHLLLVPSSTDLTVTINAPGYKPWIADNRAETGHTINLKPGEELELQPKLIPEGANPTIAELLMELGDKNSIMFTLEGVLLEGDATNIKTFRFPHPQSNVTLNSMLDEMVREVAYFTYSIDTQNPHIIHIMDSRLFRMDGYVLGSQMDHIDFAGTVDSLLRVLSDKIGPFTSVQIPGPYDLLPIDLRSSIKLRGEKLAVRDALSQISPRVGKGGILWSAETELSNKKSTVLTFCCAPSLK